MVAAMIATAPGKLILTGEYAVLEGAPALVVAVNRRVVAHLQPQPAPEPSPFLRAVAAELATRRGPDDRAARAALGITVDSTAFYGGVTKLGLGSSAAVTVAATALALGVARGDEISPLDLDEVQAIALAAHASAQGARGARGSGADVAAAVHGGVIVFSARQVEPRAWPAEARLVPFFTGRAADTATLVAQVAAARAARPREVEAALTSIADASRAACAALSSPAAAELVDAIERAGAAVDRLAAAARIELVPECVRAAREALRSLGGTAKTTGAGGGDVGIAMIPGTADASEVTRRLIEAGCAPLRDLGVETGGVDLRPIAS